jgi:hypothetical protein
LSGARRSDAHQRHRRNDGDDRKHDHHLEEREAALGASSRNPSHLFLSQLVHRYSLHKKASLRFHPTKSPDTFVPTLLGKGDAIQRTTAFLSLLPDAPFPDATDASP